MSPDSIPDLMAFRPPGACEQFDQLAPGAPVTGLSDETDAGLLALDRQFNAIVAELHALCDVRAGRSIARAGEQLPHHARAQQHACEFLDDDGITARAEAILARLDPIERAIMAAPARTIAGLGVKARHAAYVMSRCWDEPIDSIDWDARAVRLLIDAVCKLARVPLPFEAAADDTLGLVHSNETG